MVDEQQHGGESAPFRCPWCSAVLPAPDLEDCPSCGATLTSASEAALPGVTAIDHEAIARGAREAIRQPRSRLFSWLSGDYGEEAPAPSGAIAPPDAAVRREMLRLQVQAELADRQAEADSIIADAAVEGRPLPGLLGSELDESVPEEGSAEESSVAAIAAADGEAATDAVPETGSVPAGEPESDRPA
jgi:hypothetical protein